MVVVVLQTLNGAQDPVPLAHGLVAVFPMSATLLQPLKPTTGSVQQQPPTGEPLGGPHSLLTKNQPTPSFPSTQYQAPQTAPVSDRARHSHWQLLVSHGGGVVVVLVLVVVLVVAVVVVPPPQGTSSTWQAP